MILDQFFSGARLGARFALHDHASSLAAKFLPGD